MVKGCLEGIKATNACKSIEMLEKTLTGYVNLKKKLIQDKAQRNDQIVDLITKRQKYS